MTPQQRQRTPWSLEGRLKPMGRTGLQTSMHPRGREPPDRTPTPTRWHLDQHVTTQKIPPGSKPPANSQYLSFEVHLTTVTDGFNDKYNHSNDAFDAQVHCPLPRALEDSGDSLSCCACASSSQHSVGMDDG